MKLHGMKLVGEPFKLEPYPLGYKPNEREKRTLYIETGDVYKGEVDNEGL